MNYLASVDTMLEKILSNPVISIGCIILIGFIIRVYFTPWHLPTDSFDSIFFMIEGLEYSNGDFSGWSNRFLWPLFLSLFFLIFNFENNFDYTNLFRILSITISVSTISIVYFIAKKYVSIKYAILAALFFAIEPNLIENSIFGMTEPLFILLGSLSFYCIIQSKQKYQLLAFIFAGLSFDTRLNGIVLLFLLASTFIINKNERTKKTLGLGILIFFIISFPAHFLIPLEEGFSPFPIIKEIGINVEQDTTTYSTYTSDPSSNSLILNAVVNEFLHIFRISIPFLVIFVPIGMIFSIMKLDFKHKVLFLVIGISLIIAIPQYTVSNEYRNLFFLIPFFCIFSGIGLEKLTQNISIKNIFLIVLFAGLILLSGNFLRERYDIDETLYLEKDAFGNYIANNLMGNITGDLRLEIVRNIPNLKDSTYFTNGIISFYDPGRIIDSENTLTEYIIRNNINYLVIDKNEQKSHFPIFDKIISEEDSFVYLSKDINSRELDYTKLNVEIYKINLDDLLILNRDK
jgi:hypothetical protein